jgi:hypothetical protein
VQILWFGRPQGKQMPQSESCVPRQDPIPRHDLLTLPSARAAPYSSMLCRPAEIQSAATTVQHSHPLVPPTTRPCFCRPRSLLPKLAELAELAQTRPCFRRPAPHSPNSPNSPKPDLTPNFDVTAFLPL